MAPSEQSPETQQPQRSNPAQALGVIAAVSVLGLMATRVKPGPLLFLAGAAAAAWLNKRRILPPSQPLILMPERPTEEKAPDTAPQIDAWLTRQIAREQDAPIITLDLQEHLPFKPNAEATAAQQPMPSPFFDEVPAVTQPPELPPQWRDNPFLNLTEDAPAPSAVFEPATLQNLQALEATESAPTSQASWLHGIEPLPSWDELSVKTTAAEPYAPQFLDQPPGAATYTEQAQEPAPIQPVFLPPLFQGGALPDEFCVSDAEIEIEPMRSLPANEPLATHAVPPPEPPRIDIPFESLFSAPISTLPLPHDNETTVPKPVFVSSRPIFGTPPSLPPVFVVTTNPEEPPQPKPAFGIADTQPTTPFTTASPASLGPVPASETILARPGEASFDDPLDAIRPERFPPPALRPHAALVEAEIIVRPRGLTAAPPPLNESPSLPSAPIVVPREQRARKTWRSWWRGE